MKVRLSPFLPDILPVKKEDGGRPVYQTQEPIVAQFGHSEWRILPGFETDFGSIPRPLWVFYHPADPDLAVCYIFHDFLYRCEIYPRSICDYLFREAILTMTKSRFDAYVIWSAVRSGGWSSYGKQSAEKLRKLRESQYMPTIPLKRPFLSGL